METKLGGTIKTNPRKLPNLLTQYGTTAPSQASYSHIPKCGGETGLASVSDRTPLSPDSSWLLCIVRVALQLLARFGILGTMPSTTDRFGSMRNAQMSAPAK
jgi:hypothetical protein